MKARILFIMMTLAFANVKAQNYMISFTGTGASTTVDSVIVKNLVQGTALSLGGSDILKLVGVIGIGENGNSHGDQLDIYPNPVNETGYVGFESPVRGKVVISITDVAGKVVSGSEQTAMSGWNVVAVTGLPPGIYAVVVLSEKFRFSGKLISIRSTAGLVAVSPLTANHHHHLLKTTDIERSIVQMQYNDGEQLLFFCYSGTYTTVVPLVPTQNMTLISNFVPCADAQGNHYPVVEIGSQVWMAKNLNIGTLINGSQNQTDNGIIEKYCYNSLESNCNIYGGLYQWDEAMQYVTTPGAQGICPTGWHLPAVAEWTTLTTLLGSEIVAGGKMKETGTTHWLSPNTGAINSSGLTALPGGYRSNDGNFYGLTRSAYFWSSSQNGATEAWNRYLYFDLEYVNRGSSLKGYGFSCRCLKD